jgi:hypothetical protein|tara:strand:+ start:497 stop:676 length:180 start_codon:yes stop_codon:yes gene_type:complete
MSMVFCNNIYCESEDEPLERISDYRFTEDGAVICVGCDEREQDEAEMVRQNQPDYDYLI